MARIQAESFLYGLNSLKPNQLTFLDIWTWKHGGAWLIFSNWSISFQVVGCKLSKSFRLHLDTWILIQEILNSYPKSIEYVWMTNRPKGLNLRNHPMNFKRKMKGFQITPKWGIWNPYRNLKALGIWNLWISNDGFEIHRNLKSLGGWNL